MRHQPRESRESNLQETGEARDYDSVGEGGNQGAGKNGDQAESN